LFISYPELGISQEFKNFIVQIKIPEMNEKEHLERDKVSKIERHDNS
jgi:hypothetical protein